MGVRHIELGGGIEPGTFDEQWLRKHDGSYLLHNYFPPPAKEFVLNLASPEQETRCRSMRFVRQALDLTARLGGRLYSVHSGFATDPVGASGDGFRFGTVTAARRQEASERFVDNLQKLVAYASDVGVKLCIENNVATDENRGKLLGQKPHEIARFCRRVEGLGVLLDTGHLKTACGSFGIDLVDGVESVSPWIRAIHLHDNHSQRDLHEPIQSGSQVLQALEVLNLDDIDIVVEAKFESAASLGRHRGWLADQLGISIDTGWGAR